MDNPKPQIRTTDGRGRLFDSVVDTIGDTPLVREVHADAVGSDAAVGDLGHALSERRAC